MSLALTPNFANRENIAGEAGITGNNQQPINWGPPTLGFSSGITALTDGQSTQSHRQTSAVNADNTWIHGRHNIQFGGDYKKQAFKPDFADGSAGVRSGLTAPPRGGNDFAGFLLGVPDTSSIAFGNADKYLRSGIYEAYFQDDLRLSPSLTVNVGLRWEYNSPITELYGRLVNLDIAPGYSAVAPVVASNPKGPLTGQTYPDSLIHPDKHAFQPRLALSWRPFPASSMVGPRRLQHGLQHFGVPEYRAADGSAVSSFEKLERSEFAEQSVNTVRTDLTRLRTRRRTPLRWILISALVMCRRGRFRCSAIFRQP